MNYYKLKYDYEHASEAIFLNIDRKLLGFDPWHDIYLGIKLNEDMFYCTIFEKPENSAGYHYIGNNMQFLVVDETVRDLLEQLKIGDHQFIPVVEKNTGAVMGYFVHCMNLVPALDEEHSVFLEHNNLLAVMKYALTASKIKDDDMFLIPRCGPPYFVSERVKKCFQANHIKGFRFDKVDMF